MRAVFWLYFLCATAHAQTDIQFWHSMSSLPGGKVADLARQFNASQREYRVVPVFKGNYQDSMTAAIAAFRARRAPDIVQVFDVATATMMAAKGAVKPVYVLMKEQGIALGKEAFFPAVANYYADPSGNLVSLPFNVSTTALYLNRDALKAVGEDANQPPKTWKEFLRVAEKLKLGGHKCAYTTQCPSCVHIENFAARHDIPIATRDNGMLGLDAVFVFNDALHLRQMTMLADMAKRGVFSYSGRLAEADARFAAGECAMLTSSTSAMGNIRRNARFAPVVAALPYHDDIAAAPRNLLVGGASLWVMSGRPAAHEAGIARFLKFLAEPAQQAAWHQATGYLPASAAAFEIAKKAGHYQQNPGADLAVAEFNRPITANTRGIRFGNFVEGRRVIDEELELMFVGKKTPKAALDDAVSRGNALLRRFEAANR